MTTPRYSSVLALACALSVCFLWIEPVRAMGPKPPPEPPGPASVRNVIIMIGDGMGPEQVALARLFAPGGELAMDRLDGDPSFITTHNVDGTITDSAAAGTALATGVKTFDGAIGVDVDGNPVENVRERAEAHGKPRSSSSAGVGSTTRSGRTARWAIAHRHPRRSSGRLGRRTRNCCLH